MVSLSRKHLAPSGSKRPGGVAETARMVWSFVVWLLVVNTGWSQGPPVHYQYAGNMPPGAIGYRQLGRGGPLQGYFQPVRITAPPGVWITTATAGAFDEDQQAPLTVGLLIGEAYRLRVSGIPRNEGLEVFPTIELVDRLYPPPGMETRFPIPIHLTRDELEMALAGKMVTRVIYVEDPRTAIPLPDDPKRQRYFEVLPGEDPLQVADQIGRPVAILRMGSRVPSSQGPDGAFFLGSPPLQRYEIQTRAPQSVELPVRVSLARPAYASPRPTMTTGPVRGFLPNGR